MHISQLDVASAISKTLLQLLTPLENVIIFLSTPRYGYYLRSLGGRVARRFLHEFLILKGMCIGFSFD